MIKTTSDKQIQKPLKRQNFGLCLAFVCLSIYYFVEVASLFSIKRILKVRGTPSAPSRPCSGSSMPAPGLEERRDCTPSDSPQTPALWEGQQGQVGVTVVEVVLQVLPGVEEVLLAQE